MRRRKPVCTWATAVPALMQDQLPYLARHGIAAASIDSSQSREHTQDVMAKARAGTLKILMISVERLKNERFRNFITQIPASLLVVDEAHCISEWGHNFRPDYRKLPDDQRQFNIPQALLFTATAAVVADMQAKFNSDAMDVVCTGFYRPNLNLLVEPVSGADKLHRLTQWLTPRAQQSGIVYVTLQKQSRRLVEPGATACPQTAWNCSTTRAWRCWRPLFTATRHNRVNCQKLRVITFTRGKMNGLHRAIHRRRA